MRSLVALLAIVSASGCAPARNTPEAPGPSVATRPPDNLYARIPAEIDAFKLTERAIVRGMPTDSLFRYSDGSRTILTVIIYEVVAGVKIDADSQKWTAREGEKFKLVQEIRRDRGQIADFVVAFSDSVRFTTRHGVLLEHAIGSPTRLANGSITVELQYLYLIGGKFVKVRATIPEPGWQQSRALIFACEFARRMAGGEENRQPPRSRESCLAGAPDSLTP